MLRVLLPVLLVVAVVIVIAVLAGRGRSALPPSAAAGPPQLPGLSPPRALPGWYPDPEAAGRQRWWDGVAWTLDTRDDPHES